MDWIVEVKGGPNEKCWEISVVRSDNIHGQRSYGWFDENKLLVGHDGGPCDTPVVRFVWDRLILIAEELCCELNREV